MLLLYQDNQPTCTCYNAITYCVIGLFTFHYLATSIIIVIAYSIYFDISSITGSVFISENYYCPRRIINDVRTPHTLERFTNIELSNIHGTSHIKPVY